MPVSAFLLFSYLGFCLLIGLICFLKNYKLKVEMIVDFFDFRFNGFQNFFIL